MNLFYLFRGILVQFFHHMGIFIGKWGGFGWNNGALSFQIPTITSDYVTEGVLVYKADLNTIYMWDQETELDKYDFVCGKITRSRSALDRICRNYKFSSYGFNLKIYAHLHISLLYSLLCNSSFRFVSYLYFVIFILPLDLFVFLIYRAQPTKEIKDFIVQEIGSLFNQNSSQVELDSYNEVLFNLEIDENGHTYKDLFDMLAMDILS